VIDADLDMKPNSQECSFFGRKLSCIICDIAISEGCEIWIGSERDDEIFFDTKDWSPKQDEMLKERVLIMVGDEDTHIEIDLEGVLRFAAKYCTGIYKRVMNEINED